MNTTPTPVRGEQVLMVELCGIVARSGSHRIGERKYFSDVWRSSQKRGRLDSLAPQHTYSEGQPGRRI